MLNGKLRLLLAMAITASAWPNLGFTAESMGNLDAHVHGISEMTVAIEGTDIEIAFESPAMNLVGFEHKATSKKDKATVKSVVAALKQHQQIFSFAGSDCELVDSSVDASGVLKDAHGHKKDSHDHHDHDDHAEGAHSEIVANYHYRCEQLKSLSGIDVNLFKSFPGIHKVNVMWLSETQQGAASLSSSNRTIGIK